MTLPRRVPQPGDRYLTDAAGCWTVLSVTPSGVVYVAASYHNWHGVSFMSLPEFHRLIEDLTWGTA